MDGATSTECFDSVVEVYKVNLREQKDSIFFYASYRWIVGYYTRGRFEAEEEEEGPPLVGAATSASRGLFLD